MSDLTVSASDSGSTDSPHESVPKENDSDTKSGDPLPALDARLTALERAVTDGETDLHTLADTATLDTRLDDLEARTTEIETRLDELDAAIQSLRGYVGAVRAVNREVERRADAALSAVDRLADADDTEQFGESDETADFELPDSPGDLSTETTDTDDTDDATDGDDASEVDGGDDSAETDTGPRDDFADRVRDLL